MTRKDVRAPRRDPDPPPRGRKGGGLLAGLVMGLLAGLVLAAVLAWYFKLGAGSFRSVDGPPRAEKPTATEAGRSQSAPPPAALVAPAPPPTPEPAPVTETAPATETARTKKVPPAEPPSPAVKPRVDYTFYGILPGDKPAKPVEPPRSNETWWLQVAALKSPGDADRLKARLALLGLQVATQKVESGGQSLYRVRVGPYRREDDAFGDLDTLAQNNFEPRLFKEPIKP